MKKECIDCKKILQLEDFGKCNRNKKRGTHFGRNQRCKVCARNRCRASRYNVDIKVIEELLKIDNCQICNKKLNGREKCVDHDHSSGKIRGILCVQCNAGLGNFYDNINNLLNSIKYLNKTK